MARMLDRAALLANCLTGLPVMLVALWFICAGDRQPAILIASVFFFCICLTDTFFTRIPNPLNLAMLTAGLAYNAWLTGAAGVGWALLGMLAGFALFVIPYALGMGAGDVKALAALGALLGPAQIFQVFLYTALIGGALAILHYCFTSDFWQRSQAALYRLHAFFNTKDFNYLKPDPVHRRRSFPYAAAIALGFFAFVHWGPIVTLLAPR